LWCKLEPKARIDFDSSSAQILSIPLIKGGGRRRGRTHFPVAVIGSLWCKLEPDARVDFRSSWESILPIPTLRGGAGGKFVSYTPPIELSAI
jgi:hypothetical protein